MAFTTFIYYGLLTIVAMVLAASLASFLMVVMYRTAASCSLVKDSKGKVLETAPFWRGRSVCDHCQRPITAKDNIPLLSFLLLKGRCRHCQQPIDRQYFMAELVAAVYALGFMLVLWFSWSAVQSGSVLVLAAQFIFYLVLIFVVWSDLRYLIIPDAYLIILSLLVIIMVGSNWLSGLLAVATSLVFFLFLYYLVKLLWHKEALGWADIKLIIPLSYLVTWPNNLIAIFLSFIIGGFFATILLLSKRKQIGQLVPFGPFLVLGFLISINYAQPLLNWYLACL